MAKPRVTRNKPVSRKGTPVAPIEAVSELQKSRFLDEFRREHNIPNALAKGGFDRPWLKRLLAEDKAFRDAFRAIRREWVEKIERKAFEVAAAGDGPMMRFILQSLRPNTYGQKSKVDIKIEDISKLSDEELAELIKKCGVKDS
ncbi:hypothetical protein [Singulisphaera sp. PoT]|uniref:hypothetical protein n=1 Tax=Singulisphaera sp. PoT TaxID=3411797 RepID=UPI003BF4F6E5